MIKEGATFYYVTPRFFTKNHVSHKEFVELPYEFHEKDMHYYKEECMFTNEKKAKKYAKKLTIEQGY